MLAGWFTAEVGRQPWVVYGLLRTADAVTPSLTGANVLFSLVAYVAVYCTFIPFGVYYIYKLLRDGPKGEAAKAIPGATANRPMAFADEAETATGGGGREGVTGVEASPLALFWAGVIAVAILVYVILDGFDLGVGVLFGTTRDEEKRVQMMNTIAPFWDGNETWLVVIGAGLFAAFPVVYAVFLGAFYMPVLLLLFGLIFRGIAFEFRHRSERMRWLWDRGFFLGSTVAAFVQGAAIGAMMQGIPVANNQYAGGAFDWVAPFPVLTGIGLVLGYALLGAGWLVMKSEGELRDWAFARIPWLAGAVLVVLAVAVSLTLDYSAVAKSHWGDRRWGVVFPVIGVLALLGILLGRAEEARRAAVRDDGVVLPVRVPDARRDVLAVHDPVQRHRREGGGAGSVAELPLLRRGDRAAGDRGLHRPRVLGVPRQGARGLRLSGAPKKECGATRAPRKSRN